jgi:carbon-monoxide dehydrogenase small subunit
MPWSRPGEASGREEVREMRVDIELTVNGRPHRLSVEPRHSLLRVLREDLGLTGVKNGCEDGDCGACVVLLAGEPVDSCLLLAVEADGSEVTTIEGLSRDGELSPIQRAFVQAGAVQCGYCTPGMILATTALLERDPDPDEDEVKAALVGHLCRCTGYVKILEAVRLAAKLQAAEVPLPSEEVAFHG